MSDLKVGDKVKIKDRWQIERWLADNGFSINEYNDIYITKDYKCSFNKDRYTKGGIEAVICGINSHGMRYSGPANGNCLFTPIFRLMFDGLGSQYDIVVWPHWFLEKINDNIREDIDE